MQKKIVIDVPKNPVQRYIFRDERHVDLDMRGIRNPHSPMNGRLNPSKGAKSKWLSPEHLQCMVDEYFESCNGPLFNNKGELLRDNDGHILKGQVKPYTVSGLALYLGISTQTLKTYREGRIDSLLDEMKAQTEDKLTFSRVVLDAKQRIEAYAEGRLYDRDGQRGAQYVLDCCYGWVDHQTKSNIKKAKADIKAKKRDLAMKESLLGDSEDDNDITISIVRKKKDTEED